MEASGQYRAPGRLTPRTNGLKLRLLGPQSRSDKRQTSCLYRHWNPGPSSPQPSPCPFSNSCIVFIFSSKTLLLYELTVHFVSTVSDSLARYPTCIPPPSPLHRALITARNYFLRKFKENDVLTFPNSSLKLQDFKLRQVGVCF